MAGSFYLNYRTLGEVVRWYLSQDSSSGSSSSSMAVQTDSTLLTAAGLHGPVEADMVNFAGSSISFEICRQGEAWICLLRRARASTLILLLSAGGAVLYYYLARKQRRRALSARGHQKGGGSRRFGGRRGQSLWQWLFAEELVDDFTAEDSYFLHSHYFGPSRTEEGGDGSGGRLEDEELLLRAEDADEDREDCSLNCLSRGTSPQKHKFLKRPLFDIRQRGKAPAYASLLQSQHCVAAANTRITNPCPRCVKGTCRLRKHQQQQLQHQLMMRVNGSSNSSSSSNSSPLARGGNLLNGQKTSTPELNSSVLSRTLTAALPYFFHRGDGDGSEETSDRSSPSGLREELSASSDTPIRFFKDPYRPSYRLYGGVRGMPDGRERWSSMSPVPQQQQQHSSCSSPSCEEMLFSAAYRDSSVDSLAGLASSYDEDSCCNNNNNSMQDLVQQAREVRRLIREVSLDSDASDLSLADFGLGGGCGDAMLNSHLLGGDQVRNISPDFRQQHERSVDSEVSYSMRRDDLSCPDIAGLKSMRRSSQSIWRLTHFASGGRDETGSVYNFSRQGSVASGSSSSLLEWESPLHHYQQESTWHDVKPIKLALHTTQAGFLGSANVSEFGDDAASGLDPWEWDNEVCYYMDGEPVELLPEEQEVLVPRPHSTWLPDENTELDLETELRLVEVAAGSLRQNSLASAASSRRSSLDILCMRRLPPSGRSSMERELSTTTAGDNPAQQQQFHHHHHHHHHNIRRSRRGSVSSDESGYLEGESSAASTCSMTSSLISGPMDVSSNSSCLFSSTINLSPVKEARDEAAVTSSPNKLLPGSSPPGVAFVSPAIRFGDITTTDTVIKISLPLDQERQPGNGSGSCSAAQRQLFSEDSRE